MWVGRRLHAGKINCLVSKLVDGYLGVFAREKLPDVTSEIRPWVLILNTDPKNQFRTYWLALYASLAGGIELFDSFEFYSRIYSLDVLDPFHLCFSLQSPSSSVCGHYCIVYIYLCSYNHSFSDIVYLLTKISSRKLSVNSIFTICKFVFAFSIHVTVLVNIANYNVNFVKQIKMWIKWNEWY